MASYGTNPPRTSKGRAQSYSNYYKGDPVGPRTPSSSPGSGTSGGYKGLPVGARPGLDPRRDSTPFKSRKGFKYDDGDEQKREALKRRLKKLRKK